MIGGGKGERKCGKGKPCGATCIERRKYCLVDANQGIKESLPKVAKAISERKVDKEREIRELEARRVSLVDEVYGKLSKDRGDGQGTHFEHPTKETFEILNTLKKQTEEIDSRLNRLEDKPLIKIRSADGKITEHEPKRWYPDRFNLDEKFMKFKTDARERYVAEVIQKFLDKGQKGDPPQAIFMMGGPGSGKTTLLAEMMKGKTGFVHIDPDAIKVLLPEYQFGIAMGYRGIANTTNVSSGNIATRLGRRVRSAGLNHIWDGTGAHRPGYEEMVKELRKKGYNLQLVAQHIPSSEGVKRALARAELPLSLGGGRFVPLEAVEGAYQKVPRNFEPLAKLFDSASITDGMTGKEIMRYEGGKVASEDAQAAKAFRDQYGEEG